MFSPTLNPIPSRTFRLKTVTSGAKSGLFIALLIALVSAIPAIAQTITISQPANNATVSSPFTLTASATDSNGIAYTQVYVDGNKAYEVLSGSLSTTLTMSAGSHRIAVQAKDKLGNVAKSVIYVNVSTTTSNDSTGLTVIDRIEEQTDWQTCGNCGNSGATGATASYSMTRGISSPSKDGSSSQFWIGGSYPYKNAYWYIGHSGSPSTPVSYLRYEFDIYVPSQYYSAPQAIEFECQQKANGYVYNFAWQADYARSQWRIFNYVTRAWEPTNVPLKKFSANTWHHVIAEYHAQGSTVYHDALTIDGTRYTVGVKHAAKYVGTTGHYLTNAFQLDLNGSATDYKVYVDGMKVSYK